MIVQAPQNNHKSDDDKPKFLLMKPLKTTIAFPNPPDKLEKVFLMEEDTVVAVTSNLDSSISTISIFNIAGECIYNHTLKARTMSCGSMNTHEIMYLLPTLEQWGIFDIRTRTERMGATSFRRKSLVETELHFFSESNVVAMVQRGNFADKSGRFHFIKYPISPSTATELLWQTIEEQVYTKIVKTLNDSNRLVIFDPRSYAPSSGKFNWVVLDFEKKTREAFAVDAPKLPYPDHHLIQVAEMLEGVYMLFTANINQHGNIQQHCFYAYDAATKQLKALDHLRIKYRIAPHQVFRSSNWLVIPETFLNEQAKLCPAPLRCIDLKTGTLVHHEETIAGPGNIRFSVSNSPLRYMLRVQADEEKPANMEVEWIYAFTQKELYVHILKEVTHQRIHKDMIEHVIEAFDHDYE